VLRLPMNSHDDNLHCVSAKMLYNTDVYISRRDSSVVQRSSQFKGSSVSVVSDYRLEDWAVGVSSPEEAMDFSSSLCVQTSSEAHAASYPMGTGGPFRGVKRGRGVTLTTHLHLVRR
jgi:hypothetical protein